MTREFILRYDEIPSSLNAGGAGSRRHWSVGYREKRRWEGVWALLLMEQGAPRGMSFVRVDALIEVEDKRRRDSENFRPAISKPLADALVKGGWLADDTDEFFIFAALRLRNGVDIGRGMATDRRTVIGRTTLTLSAEYPEGDGEAVSFRRTQVGA